MKALKVLRDGADVCTELELTRYLHFLVYWSMSIFLGSKIILTSWPFRPLALQCFIRMRYDDLNLETLYKLALLILFCADFDRNKNCFWEASWTLLNRAIVTWVGRITATHHLFKHGDRIYYCAVTRMNTL